MTNHIIFYLFSSIKKKSKSTCTIKSLNVVYRGSLSICLVSAVIGQDCTDWLVGKICQNLKASVCFSLRPFNNANRFKIVSFKHICLLILYKWLEQKFYQLARISQKEAEHLQIKLYSINWIFMHVYMIV